MRRANSRKRTRWVVTLAVALVCAMTAQVAIGAGFSYRGIGIKARSMGGAFRGIADDWSAASHNPAGLAFLKSSQVNLSLGVYNPRASYTPNVFESSLDGSERLDVGFDRANGQEHYPLEEAWPVPSMGGFAAPESWNGWVIGGAIFWPHDVNYAWDLYRPPTTYNTDYEFSEENYRTDIDVMDIHPTVAKSFGDNFSVGVGLSLTNGDVVFRRPIFVENTLGEPYDIYPFNEFVGDFRVDGNGFALGANAGVMWKASDNVSVGLSVKTPITMTIEGWAALDMAWPRNSHYDDDDNVIIQGTDTIRTKLYYSGINDALVQAQNTPHSEDRFEFDLDLPAELGLGVGWRANDRLMLAFDAVMTYWSAVERWDITMENGTLNGGREAVTTVSVPFGWDDQVRLAGGFDYAAKTNLMIRGGAYYETGAAVDSTFSPNFPNDGDVFGLAAGFSYLIDGHVELALAQEMAFYSERTIESIAGSNGATVFPGDYSLNRFETILSLTYLF